ncbi:MAG: hypothetical protein ACE5HT_02395 [Gemmatimonadales bacterium]
MRSHGSAATTCVVAILLGCGGASHTAPHPVELARYLPYHAGYRGVSVGEIEQQFNGQVVRNEFGTEFFVTAEVVESPSELRATLVLDSIARVRGAGSVNSSGEANSALGTTFTGRLASTGEILDFQGDLPNGALARELVDRLFRQFFPRIPAHGARAGEHWVDTLETTAVVGGVNNKVRTVNSHSAAGWLTHAGRRALQIVTVSRYAFSGSGVQAGQEFTLEGQGHRLAQHYIGADGSYLGYTATDTSHAEAKLTKLGLTIPVLQTRFDTLALTAH